MRDNGALTVVDASAHLDDGANDDWWRGAVIYQIYPRSFQDSNGDGVGDLNGITSRLDYVAGLGVDAIWLSPFFTSPMKDMGYDVSDYCNVDPVFGTLRDFDLLVSRAHELGLKVMIDQVLSHTSDQHEWFAQSRQDKNNEKADWYVWADAQSGGTPPTNWQSVFGGAAWSWDPKRCQYYLHNFLSSQPDLNFHNPQVQDALLQTVRFWLDRGVDGFRLDTVNFYFHDQLLRDNPPSVARRHDEEPERNPYGLQEHVYDKTRPENLKFLARFRALLNEYTGSTSVGEVGDGDRSLQTMAEYTAGNELLHMCYSFDMLGPHFSAKFFRKCIEDFEEASQRFSEGHSWPCWAFSNHDVIRHMTRWQHKDRNAPQFSKLAGALLLSLKGSVCLYQGEELGFEETELQFEDLTDPFGVRFWPEFKGRDGCRTPFAWASNDPLGGFSSANKAWLPLADQHIRAAANTQTGRTDSILEHYRNFLSFRKSHQALISGDLEFLPWDEEGLAFIRRSDEQAILCVFNLGNRPVHYTCPASFKLEPLDIYGFTTGLDGKTVALNGHQAFFAALS